jgi:hypothetical protein
MLKVLGGAIAILLLIGLGRVILLTLYLLVDLPVHAITLTNNYRRINTVGVPSL